MRTNQLITMLIQSSKRHTFHQGEMENKSLCKSHENTLIHKFSIKIEFHSNDLHLVLGERERKKRIILSTTMGTIYLTLI